MSQYKIKDPLALIPQEIAALPPDTEVVFRPLDGDDEVSMALAPFVRPYSGVAGGAAAYVRRDHVCLTPVTRPEELRVRLEERTGNDA